MFRKIILSLSVAAAMTGVASGDDTDIYVDNTASAPPSSAPIVIFTLDYRANVNSTLCASRGAGCPVDVFYTAEGMGAELPDSDPLTSGNQGPVTLYDSLRLALILVLRETSGYKAGLALNHSQSAGQCSGQTAARCTNGGYVTRGVRLIGTVAPRDPVTKVFQPDTDANRAELVDILKAIPSPQGLLSHPYQGKEIFFELFRYLTGQFTFNNGNGWTDYGTDTDQNLADLNDPSTGDNAPIGVDRRPDTLIKNDRKFVSPLASADACTKVFTINFLFQVTSEDAQSDAAIRAARTSGGMGFTPSGANEFSQVVGFLHDVDLAPAANKFNNALPDIAGTQNVTSFFIVKPTPEDSDPPQYDLQSEEYSVRGGTERPLPLSRDPETLVNAIRNALQQILSVSTTLVAASVPVNVFNRSEIVDNVYFALFQAQGAGAPDATNVPGGPYYWPGNLKKLRLGTTGAGRPEIQDVFGLPAIGIDGRIQANALTFWTDITDPKLNSGDRNGDGVNDARDTDADGIANYFTPPSGPSAAGTAANPSGFVTERDGRIIARGGAGHRIPGFTGGTPGDANPSGVPPSGGPRKLFYLSSSSTSASLQPLNAALTTAEVKTQLGDPAMTNTEVARLLRYARGQDVNDSDADNNDTEARYWIQGDPLHSRPLPLNYGADPAEANGPSVAFAVGHKNPKNPAIFIAMASNDGYLRMFRNTGGTTADTETPAQLGQEVWAFMPPEGMAIQKQLLDQTAPTGLPPHGYSFDGEPTALVIDQNGDGNIQHDDDDVIETNEDAVVLYIGLRRGGKAYYALNVTNPLKPVFLWRITPTSRTTTAGEAATPDFAEMGFTFSRPRVGLVKLGTNPDGSDVRRLAVFFGGGYDGGYAGSIDTDGQFARVGNDIDAEMANDTTGNAIFVVRANNAQLLWKAVKGTGAATSTVFQHPALNDSIPSNLTTVDSDADGVVDRLYVGDTGGTLWRADLGPDTDATPDGPKDDWKLTVVAKLGRHGYASPTITNDRRFFHEPDVVQSRDATGRFDAVVIGSGDRANPLDQGPFITDPVTGKRRRTVIDVDNSFYVIKDRNVGIGAGVDSTVVHDDAELPSGRGLTDITNQCLGGSSTCAISNRGWRLDLDNPNGEKALSAPVTIANAIFFTTYVPPPPFDPDAPPPTTCGPKEGNGFLYSLKLATGAPARDYNTTDGPTGADGAGTTDDDRDKELETPGIPAQVVYLGSPSTTGGGEKCIVNILAGAQIFEAPGCPRFRTFWQRFGQ
jgi:type IV pilus assembly protein PilY1